MAVLGIVSLLASAAAFGPDRRGCRGANYPCLPGMDAVGVGFDAVTGTYSGNPVIALNYTDADNVWPNPFDNGTSYSYADQATVRGHTEKNTAHTVYRSVTDYVTSQSNEAHASVSYGMFFKASVETKWASAHMSDSLSIVAVSEYEVGLYSVTLKPPQLLQAHPDFLKYVDMLPDTYDAAAYQNFITYYGTHYPFQVALGGRARMKTVVANAFSSTHSDSDITASLSASWGKLGGGGGGSSASNATSQAWQDSTTIATLTVGGDPAIDAFSTTTANGQGWANWVKSVEHGAPVVTSMQLEPVWSMVPAGPKQDNVLKAVQAYASNETFPSADLTQIRMSWCDCYEEQMQPPHSCDIQSNLPCRDFGCQKPGFVMTSLTLQQEKTDNDCCFEFNFKASSKGVQCCRPCFSAQN